MRRYLGPLLAALGLGAVLFSYGCQDDLLPPPTPGPLTGKIAPPHTSSTTYNITTKAKPVIQRACAPCHDTHNPLGVYPAGVEIHAGSPWTIVLPNGSQSAVDAISNGKAPQNRALTGGEEDTLLDYFLNHNGVDSPHSDSYTVPSTFLWRQAAHESLLTITNFAGDPYQPHGYHGFAVEMRANPILVWNTFTESGHNNLQKRVLDATFYDCVPCRAGPSGGGCLCVEPACVDSFSDSDDATFYVTPANVGFNGRLRSTEMRGYFHYPVSGSGKRFFVGMHTIVDRESFSRTTRRDVRTYIRFQVEDGKIALRMKLVGFSHSAGEAETIGEWQSVNGPSDLVAESGYGLILTGLPAMSSSKLYYYIFSSTEDGSGTHYVGQLYEGDPRDNLLNTHALIGEVRGVRASNSNAFGGFFINGWYERRDSGKYSGVADTEVRATSMQGSGENHGGNPCRDCGLDRPGR